MSSGASVSSFGSAAADPRDKEKAAGANGEGDDILEDGQATYESMVFGLVYTVNKDKEDTPREFVVGRLALEFLQLWLLIANPDFGWQFDRSNKVFQLVSIINLKDFMGARGYPFYLAFMYMTFILLLGVLAVSGWVGWCVQNNRLDQVWPQRILHWFSSACCQLLDLFVLNMFLIALDCNYFDQTPLNGNREFPYQISTCWAMPHLVHVTVAIIGLLIFIPLGLLDALGRMELNPASRSWLAMNHSQTEILAFATKCTMAALCVFVTNYKWLCVGLGACSLLLVALYLRWLPHMCAWTNHVRVASLSCVFYCSIVLVFVVYHPAVDSGDLLAVLDYRKRATLTMWAGMAPAALLGGLASWLHLRFYRVTVVKRFQTARPGTKPKFIHRFTDARQVEVAARCCRQWVDLDTLEPGHVSLAEQIIKAGVAQLPKSTFMIVLYASFLIEVQSSFQTGYSQLQAAKKNKPGLLDRFAIFIREQQHTQKAGDLVSYVEQMRNYRMVLKVHKDALLAMKAFWQALLHTTVNLKTLTDAIKRMDSSVHTAEQVYRSMLMKSNNSVKLLRVYAKFLEHIKHDPWGAAKWSAEAQRLHLVEEEQKNNIFSDLGGKAGDTGQPAWVKHMATVNDGKAVIVMDAQCIVQAANQVAHTMFGYAKNELRGRNVNLIIPPPFAEHHDQYIRNYIATGKSWILDKESEFVGLHKERYVFGVLIHISKVMGMGQDSIFMGVVEAVTSPPDTAMAWVLSNGAMLSVDAVFTDWFGHRPEDLLGGYINSLVVEKKQMDEVMRTMKEENQRREAEAEAQKQAAISRALMSLREVVPEVQVQKKGTQPVKAGQTSKAVTAIKGDNVKALAKEPATVGSGTSLQTVWKLDNVHVRHKFADVLPVGIEVKNGGVGTHLFYVLSIRRTSSAGRFMVVTDKQGRLHHITQDFATVLGKSVHQLHANGNSNALEALLPEPYIHLHRSWLAAPLPPQVPRHSCRSGVAMMLQAMGIDGPMHMPFRLRSLRKKEDPKASNTLYVVGMEQVSLQQALDDRRLTLLVDYMGKVTRVGSASSSLFGFDPQQLVGKSVTTFIDCLAPEPDALEDPLGQSGAGVEAEEDPAETAAMMVALAKRATQQPGMSWRVGVVVPLDPSIDVEALGEIGQSLLSTKKVRPAVMAVAVHVNGMSSTPQRRRASVVQGGAGGLTDLYGGSLMEDVAQDLAHKQSMQAAEAAAAAAATDPTRPGTMVVQTVVRTTQAAGGIMGGLGGGFTGGLGAFTGGLAGGFVGSLAGGGGFGAPVVVSVPAPSPVAAAQLATIPPAGPGAPPRLLAGGHAVFPAPLTKPGPSANSAAASWTVSSKGGPGPTSPTVTAKPLMPGKLGTWQAGGPTSNATWGTNLLKQAALTSATLSQTTSQQPQQASAVAMTKNLSANLSDEDAAEAHSRKLLSKVPSARVPGAAVEHGLLRFSDGSHPSGCEPQQGQASLASSETAPEHCAASDVLLDEDKTGIATAPAPGTASLLPTITKDQPRARRKSVDSGIVIELHLWRADLLSGLLEVESNGRVCNTNVNKLCPPGLVLGCASDNLVQRSVASFLPLANGLGELFSEPARAGSKGPVKSLLKSDNLFRTDKMVGPVHTLNVRHMGDGADLELSVQIVRRVPPYRNFYILLHPLAPQCGRPDFRQWLYESDGAEPVTGSQSQLPAFGNVMARHSLRNIQGNDSFGSKRSNGRWVTGAASGRPSFTASHAGGPSPDLGLPAACSARPSLDINRPAMAGGARHSFDHNHSAVAGSPRTSFSLPRAPQPPVGPHPSRMSLEARLALPPAACAVGSSGSNPSTCIGSGNRPVSDEDCKKVPGGSTAGLTPSPLDTQRSAVPVNGALINLHDQHLQQPALHTILSGVPLSASALSELGPTGPPGQAPPQLPPGGLSSVAQWVLSDGASYPVGQGQGPVQAGAALQSVPPSSQRSKVLQEPEGPRPGSGGSQPPLVWVARQAPAAITNGSSSRNATPEVLPVPRLHKLSSTSLGDVGPGQGSMRSQASAAGGTGKLLGGEGEEGVDEDSSSDDGEAAAELDPKLADAAANMGDEAGAPDHFSEQMSESGVSGGIGMQQGDYRRGVRLKKLNRKLNTALAQRVLKRFRWQSLALVLLLVVVHVGMFALIYALVRNQQLKVDDFIKSGGEVQAVARIASGVRQLDVFHTNRLVPGLTGMETQADLSALLDFIHQLVDTYMTLHAGTYLGFTSRQSLPEEHGVRTLWEVDGATCIDFYNSLPQPTTTTVVMGMWDAGNMYAQQALDVWQNHAVWANDTSRPWSSWGAVQWVTWNGPRNLYPGYFTTMDGLTTSLITDFRKLNKTQLTIMGMEAVVLCVIVLVWMWVLMTQVINFRFSMMNVFMLIPVGLARALANKPLDLGDDDDDDDGEVDVAALAPGTGGGQEAEKAGGGDDNKAPKPGRTNTSASPLDGTEPGAMIKLGGASGKDDWDASRQQMWSSSGAPPSSTLKARLVALLRRLMFWRLRANANQGGRRQLLQSYTDVVWMCWPVALWGVLLIILYMVAYNSLATISGPIATLNQIIFLQMRVNRNFFSIQELVWEQNVTIKVARRADSAKLRLLVAKEYQAMLYGAQGMPNETSHHYTEAARGVAFVGGEPTNIMFKPMGCLRADQSTCLQPSSPYYQYTVNGLDVLMQQYFLCLEQLSNSNGSEPTYQDPAFHFIWLTRLDREDGIERLTAAFKSHISKVYARTLQVHVVALVLTLLLMLGYLLFMRRPFLRDSLAETRRVAELLSQLPLEINVDDLVQRGLFSQGTLALQGSKASQSAKAAGSSRSMGSDIE